MADHSLLETALKRDRWIALLALGLVILSAWAWTLSGAGMNMSAAEMTSALGPAPAAMGAVEAAMAAPATWSLSYAVLMFFMWWAMMLAMMLPSAAPAILLFAALKQKFATAQIPALPAIAAFAAGYAVMWAAFSAIAVALQWALEQAGLLSPMMLNATSMSLAGGVLIAAGLYQLTPVKLACLRHCRSPARFIAQHWRNTTSGAFLIGARHGLYCLGCCWALMALLFFGGVMNLWWVAGLAALVAVEKLAARGAWIGRAMGVVLALWGASFLWRAFA